MPTVLRYKGKIIWYPGIVFGIPPPVTDWNKGQGLGMQTTPSLEDLQQANKEATGLVWTTTEKLMVDLEETEHLHGVVNVLELCTTLLTEPAQLVVVALSALTRICWGFQDRIQYAVKCGVCHHVSTLLHWHWSGDNAQVLTKLFRVVIMLADSGGKEVRTLFGTLGCAGYITAALKWNRLRQTENSDILELGCRAIYQLVLGNTENRLLLRQAGADKELYCISRDPIPVSPGQQQQVKDLATQLLAMMKDQLISDLGDTEDTWFVSGAIRMAISDIKYVVPSPSNEEKSDDLVQAGMYALLRILSTSQETDRLKNNNAGSINWNKTTQLTLFGTCELLVQVLRYFGHYKNCVTTACRSISCMLLPENSSGLASSSSTNRLGISLETNPMNQMVQEIEATSSSQPDGRGQEISKYRRKRAVSWEETPSTEVQLLLETASIQDIDLDVSSSDEETDTSRSSDVEEVDVLEAVVKEQQMMLLLDASCPIEMAEINSNFHRGQKHYSNFDLALPTKEVEHEFKNGVRVVSKSSHWDGVDNADRDNGHKRENLTNESPYSSMVSEINVIQIDVRSRQDRFQASGICEALVEILKISYQEAMMLPEPMSERVDVASDSLLEGGDSSSIFKSAVSGFSSLFAKKEPSLFFDLESDKSTNRKNSSKSIHSLGPPIMSPRYRKDLSKAKQTKKSFQFRNMANDLLESICEVIRRLVKQNVYIRMDFYRVALHSVLYKIRLDTSLPDSDLDCVGSLQTWLNQSLVDELGHLPCQLDEAVLLIKHSLALCVGSGKALQCFVLLEEDSSDNFVTESVVVIQALKAVVSCIGQPNKLVFLDTLFGTGHGTVENSIAMKLIMQVVTDYAGDLEVISQWCTTISSLASSTGNMKEQLGRTGVCSAAVGLLDLHKTRPSLVQDILWCLCMLAGNNQKNLVRILKWKSSRDPSKVNIVSLLQALYRSRSQTNETREHAELLLGWLDIASSIDTSERDDITSQNTVASVGSGPVFPTFVATYPSSHTIDKPAYGVADRQNMTWFTAESGIWCFDGEVSGFYGNMAEEIYWGAVEI